MARSIIKLTKPITKQKQDLPANNATKWAKKN